MLLPFPLAIPLNVNVTRTGEEAPNTAWRDHGVVVYDDREPSGGVNST